MQIHPVYSYLKGFALTCHPSLFITFPISYLISQYGIKKKEVEGPREDPDVEGRLGRKKKTPAEMAAEAAAAEEEEDSKFSNLCCCFGYV